MGNNTSKNRGKFLHKPWAREYGETPEHLYKVMQRDENGDTVNSPIIETSNQEAAYKVWKEGMREGQLNSRYILDYDDTDVTLMIVNLYLDFNP